MQKGQFRSRIPPPKCTKPSSYPENDQNALLYQKETLISPPKHIGQRQSSTRQLPPQVDQAFERIETDRQQLQQRKQKIISKLNSIGTNDQDVSLKFASYIEQCGTKKNPKIKYLMNLAEEKNRRMLLKLQTIDNILENEDVATEHRQEKFTTQMKTNFQTQLRNNSKPNAHLRVSDRFESSSTTADQMAWEITEDLFSDPSIMVRTLIPEALPKAAVDSSINDVLIPEHIPMDRLFVVSDLDRNTTEMVLKTNSVPVPSSVQANVVLDSKLQAIKRTGIKNMLSVPDPRFEIELKLAKPRRQNLLQLQGSSVPHWFPGYFSCFTGPPAMMQSMTSPANILAKARGRIHHKFTNSN
ncbi:uncharacterized protein LOC129754739 [Uranotaenia lowii]|uniref:uncharacterized protein LOC129754739 n=1 Tax=Uranotaenia lowii TaxID=190385 RepID=UPI00247A512C|nr:uncharacterized protein LOC129754739 [Uranotaenia lowii]